MILTPETLAMYVDDCGDCMLWKLGTNGQGYAQARLNGQPQLVGRYIVQAWKQQKVSSRHAVTTRCGDRRCVAPDHLVVRLRGAIQADSYANGKRRPAGEYAERLRKVERMGWTSLTWDKVRQIRAMPEDMSHAEIARQFGASHKAVSEARRGVTWRQQAPASSVFTWRPA